eukprot:SAG11_NODE_1451_length_4880_cov_3.477724_1_plen_162_part_00
MQCSVSRAVYHSLEQKRRGIAATQVGRCAGAHPATAAERAREVLGSLALWRKRSLPRIVEVLFAPALSLRRAAGEAGSARRGEGGGGGEAEAEAEARHQRGEAPARRGTSEARRGEARRGTNEARRGEARRGEARRGEARRGEARRGGSRGTVRVRTRREW